MKYDPADLERCTRFADHYYKFFDALVVTVVTAINSYNAELPLAGLYRISHKREGYWFRAHLASDPSCAMDFAGYLDSYPTAGGYITCSYCGRGKANEQRRLATAAQGATLPQVPVSAGRPSPSSPDVPHSR